MTDSSGTSSRVENFANGVDDVLTYVDTLYWSVRSVSNLDAGYLTSFLLTFLPAKNFRAEVEPVQNGFRHAASCTK